MLRGCFIVGWVLHIVLAFVPMMEVKTGGFWGFGVQEKSLSPFQAGQMLFEQGTTVVGFLYVIYFSLTVAFLVLGIVRPVRWVFVAGASYGVFFVILAFSAGSPPENVTMYVLPEIVSYLAIALTLSGFWTKPPESDLKGDL